MQDRLTRLFYKKALYKKVVLDSSNSYDGSVLDFANLRKFENQFFFQIKPNRKFLNELRSIRLN